MSIPLATHDLTPGGLDAALEFLKRTRWELRQLRRVHVWKDRLQIFDINGDYFEVRGVGYLTGANVCLRFLPAPPGAGVAFVRTDLTPPAKIPARFPLVTGTNRRTTLGHFPRCVTLVEHVLAALAGLRIDNCYVELNAPEPPGLDGSALSFVRVLHQAGCVLQSARRSIVSVDRKTVVAAGGASLAVYPDESDGEDEDAENENHHFTSVTTGFGFLRRISHQTPNRSMIPIQSLSKNP